MDLKPIMLPQIKAAFEDIRRDNERDLTIAPAVAALSDREIDIIIDRAKRHHKDCIPFADIICDVIECRPTIEEAVKVLESNGFVILPF